MLELNVGIMYSVDSNKIDVSLNVYARDTDRDSLVEYKALFEDVMTSCHERDNELYLWFNDVDSLDVLGRLQNKDGMIMYMDMYIDGNIEEDEEWYRVGDIFNDYLSSHSAVLGVLGRRIVDNLKWVKDNLKVKDSVVNDICVVCKDIEKATIAYTQLELNMGIIYHVNSNKFDVTLGVYSTNSDSLVACKESLKGVVDSCDESVNELHLWLHDVDSLDVLGRLKNAVVVYMDVCIDEGIEEKDEEWYKIGDVFDDYLNSHSVVLNKLGYRIVDNLNWVKDNLKVKDSILNDMYVVCEDIERAMRDYTQL